MKLAPANFGRSSVEFGVREVAAQAGLWFRPSEFAHHLFKGTNSSIPLWGVFVHWLEAQQGSNVSGLLRLFLVFTEWPGGVSQTWSSQLYVETDLRGSSNN